MGFTEIPRLTGCTFVYFLSYLYNFIHSRMMTNKILTHLCLATAQDLPGRNNSPALERLKILSRGLDQRHTEEFNRKLAIRNGDDLRVKNVSRNFEDHCKKRVNKLWWSVRERGNFGFHRKCMKRRVVKRQRMKKLELPPLEFIARTLTSPGEDERASEPNFGLSQSQFRPNSQSQSHPMHQPVGQTMPQEQPQVRHDLPLQGGLYSSTSQNVGNYTQTQWSGYDPRPRHPNSQQVWGLNENLQNTANI